jgi:cell division protein FtsN
MKSKIYLFGLAFCLLFSLNACKSKQSAYKAAYEAAQERELEEAAKQDQTAKTKKTSTTSSTTTSKVSSSTSTNSSTYTPPAATFQKEKVTVVDGNTLRPYSVVIGSFINKTNATSLKERMAARGYSPVLVQNEKGMYRVIVATFNDRARAVAEKESIKELYAPDDFQDTWLLEQE